MSGSVTEVRINGLTTTEALAQGVLDWWQVWPSTAVAGQPLWVAFHSRDAAWDGATAGTLTVSTDAGDALAGSFPVTRAPVPLTYVTTSPELDATVIHVKNTDTVAHTLTNLHVDGRDVLTTGAVCVPKTTLTPGETAMWTVPCCTAVTSGAQTLDISVAVPTDVEVDDVFEIVDGEVVDVPAGAYAVTGRSVTLSSVTLSNTTPTRVFVLAANPGVRFAMAAAGAR